MKLTSFFMIPSMASLLVSLLSVGNDIELSNAGFVPSPSLAVTTAAAHVRLVAQPQHNPNSSFVRRCLKPFRRNDEENDDNKGKEMNTNLPSWWLPSSHPESATRRERLVRIHEEMQRFAHGSELGVLRSDIDSLKDNLKWALATDDVPRIIDLSSAIEKAEDKDPEVVYSKALQKIKNAQEMNVSKKYQLLPKFTDEALTARQYIYRLNMEGLWIGNFGTEGSGLVNVTYVGDTMIAKKVTGECSLPKGEVLFRANLFPDSDEKEKNLDPIPLSSAAASKWGSEKLERYSGEGQVVKSPSSSSSSSKDSEFVEGQVIMFDGYFSFLYLPSKQHVFFSRPGPDLVLHLMKSVLPVEDETQNMRVHLETCYDKDIDFSFVNSKRDEKHQYLRNDNLLSASENTKWTPRSLKEESTFSFWAFHKWMNYIDDVLRPPEADEN